MRLVAWDDLPEAMRSDVVRPYYDFLKGKRLQLVLKRAVDIVGSSVLLVVFSPLFAVLAIAIKVDSPGPVFYRQIRVTQYGRQFRIFKFRTMRDRADRLGSAVTMGDDPRITRVGKMIRKYRLDEFSQLIDVLRGTMTFVGTRPEVPRYVDAYTPEMRATLLLPAGVTSTASIVYKDEAELLEGAFDPDRIYVDEVLPRKMEYNLRDVREFTLTHDLLVVGETIRAVFGAD